MTKNLKRVYCKYKTIPTQLIKNLIKKEIKGFWRNPYFYLFIITIVLFGTSFFIKAENNSIQIKDSDKKDLKEQTSFSSFVFSESQFNQSFSSSLFITQEKQKIEISDLNITQKNSLVAVSSPINLFVQTLGTLNAVENNDKKEIIEYIVQEKDTLSTLSEKFNISKETILWANDLNKNSKIKSGDKLIILPFSGILHYVKSGDTINEIAETYKAKSTEIVVSNQLSNENDLYIGDILLIPNGVLPVQTKEIEKKEIEKDQRIPLADNYFIYPISSPRVSQGLHRKNAIDITNGECGTPVFAVAQGVVLRTKFGWNYGGGNFVTIQHPNEVVTYYGHLQSILVKPNETVSQGQIIGLMGGQPGTPGAGRSTGCHVHLAVYGAKNPFSK